eukprot:TRINITY_DN598_c0_g1_i2.p1 TRINITY_DN598_c0_g1~~TRINITY_DN598_c0_g1_i2.p1  ORF type:complete len:94 (+),score=8.42 TRINITY_DN598_c0_g1_i2:126-407(+)
MWTADMIHLALHSKIDIQLDPFPWNGTTTSCESIWMGVPVLSLKRSKFPIHAHNVGVSLFSRVPSLRKGFVTTTKQEYIDKAIEWSNNISKLK